MGRNSALIAAAAWLTWRTTRRTAPDSSNVTTFSQASNRGVTHARVDGGIVTIDPPPRLQKTLEHTIDLVVFEGPAASLDEQALSRALTLGQGSLRYHAGKPRGDSGADRALSSTRICTTCGTGIGELDPRFFSFNTKQGKCERCDGSGVEPGHDEAEARAAAAELSAIYIVKGSSDAAGGRARFEDGLHHFGQVAARWIRVHPPSRPLKPPR